MRGTPYTDSAQSIVEAAAEKVIFESLSWESRKIDSSRTYTAREAEISLDRFYRDGIDLTRDGGGASTGSGVVRVNLIFNRAPAAGVQVTYCMPIVFPGIREMFALVKEKYPCSVSGAGQEYHGVAIMKEAYFGKDPEA